MSIQKGDSTANAIFVLFLIIGTVIFVVWFKYSSPEEKHKVFEDVKHIELP